MTLTEFVLAVDRYRILTNASVTSWFRTADHNKAVGGVERSPHLTGLGVDVVYDADTEDPKTRVLTGFILGLKVISENDHDHIQPSDLKV